MNIKRYDVTTDRFGYGTVVEASDGNWVNYEDHAVFVKRVQAYCKHDGGRTARQGGVKDARSCTAICAVCGWDMDRCQHRGELGKFCSQCGEKIKY